MFRKILACLGLTLVCGSYAHAHLHDWHRSFHFNYTSSALASIGFDCSNVEIDQCTLEVDESRKFHGIGVERVTAFFNTYSRFDTVYLYSLVMEKPYFGLGDVDAQPIIETLADAYGNPDITEGTEGKKHYFWLQDDGSSISLTTITKSMLYVFSWDVTTRIDLNSKQRTQDILN